METIRVNMTPCEDIKTIHASQNDNEAREWGFELHNNGEKIDSSSISDQLVFKAYKGGTEEILPTNGSVPTTSPFKGDIKYPQGLLTDQEFTYRQSPTEEDGLAKITDIKGNTLVWNQLVQNGNFADTSNWRSSSNVSITASNNILRVTNDVGRDGDYYSAQNISMKVGHKYYFHAEAKKTDVSTAQTLLLVFFGEGSNTFAIDAIKENTNWVSKSTIFTCASNTYNFVRLRTQVANATNEFRNVVLIDLTQMGLSVSSPSEFTSLFPLPYYAYNQGTLLSFNGNGIKTVGKNRIPRLVAGSYSLNGITANVDNDGYIYVSGNAYTRGTTIQIPLEESFKLKKGMYCHAFNNRAEASITPTFGSWYFSLTPINRIAQCPDTYDGTEVTNIRLYIGANTNPNITLRPMLAFTNEVTPYEPYASSTLSLPISTYFSNGMKSAGSVYDELTETKATARMKSITFDGSENWNSDRQKYRVFLRISDIKADTANIVSAKYPTISPSETYAGVSGIAVGGSNLFVGTLGVSVADWKTYLASNPLTVYYELATPTETTFTTASLVTENAEIPLSNEDGVLIGKCTEQLSSESGFFDAKIKLADEDGECYSNKLQLHIERKPS